MGALPKSCLFRVWRSLLNTSWIISVVLYLVLNIDQTSFIYLHILSISVGSKCLNICPDVFGGYSDFAPFHSTPTTPTTNEELRLRLHWLPLLYCCWCLGLANIPTSLPAGFKLLRVFFFFWPASFYCPVNWERTQWIMVWLILMSTWMFKVWEVEPSVNNSNRILNSSGRRGHSLRRSSVLMGEILSKSYLSAPPLCASSS